MKKTIVIGSGFAGLSAAACLAQEGFEVIVLEKNATAGGRARQFHADGFTFDMGPSWYWMPDVFEHFFHRFNKSVSDYYTLKRLDPSYRVYYGKQDFMDVPAGIPALMELFDKVEPGSSNALKKFLAEAEYKYAAGMKSLVYKPGLSFREFANVDLIKGIWKLNVFQSLSKYVRKFFRHPRLISLLEFPVLFLGASPDRIPALYSLMNYADMALGTWYPMGGMYKIVEGMVKIAQEHGVTFKYNCPATGVEVKNNSARGVWSDGMFRSADFVVATADYRHVEKDLLTPDARQYSNRYWEKRTLAPSCLIFFLGVNKRIRNLLHHNLFFDEDMRRHLLEIYTTQQWPTAPQFYACCPSISDELVSPEGCENLFILIPVAPGLSDEETIREKYFNTVIRRIEHLTGESILPHIVFKRSYAHNDFISDYNAFKGNAYGLANTFFQTANFKPSIVNKSVRNLYYSGQLTVPGPGVPPSIISGQVAAAELLKRYRKETKQSQRSLVK
jgi:phytoene desaturase